MNTKESLYLVKFNESYENVTSMDRLFIGERIRDIIYNEDLKGFFNCNGKLIKYWQWSEKIKNLLNKANFNTIFACHHSCGFKI